MDDFAFSYFLAFGQHLGFEGISFLLLLISYFSILIFWRFFGKTGLYVFNVLAVVAANIQVLKITPVLFSSEPVALGTLLFATTFVVSDILTEHHGASAAKAGVMLSIASQMLMMVWMTVTLCYPTIGGGVEDIRHNHQAMMLDPVQNALYILFAPSLRLFIASMLAFAISQWVDIFLFNWLMSQTQHRFLWLRSNVATLVSGFIDNLIFSILAWIVLSPTPVSWSTLFMTYILGTYGSRVLVSVTSTPVMYLSYRFHYEKLCHK